MKTEDDDEELLDEFLKEETPPVMDRIFAKPGVIAEEFRRIYGDDAEDRKKEVTESFIKENYTVTIPLFFGFRFYLTS